MQGREAGTGAPETCSFPPALPSLLCDSGPSQLTTTKWPARPGLDLTVTTCARFPGIMERVTVMLNRPCLTDGEIEAQWWERAEPQVAQHISCKGQLETRVTALSSAILGFGKEYGKSESPTHRVLWG